MPGTARLGSGADRVHSVSRRPPGCQRCGVSASVGQNGSGVQGAASREGALASFCRPRGRCSEAFTCPRERPAQSARGEELGPGQGLPTTWLSSRPPGGGCPPPSAPKSSEDREESPRQVQAPEPALQERGCPTKGGLSWTRLVAVPTGGAPAGEWLPKKHGPTPTRVQTFTQEIALIGRLFLEEFAGMPAL